MAPKKQLVVLRHAKSSWDDPGLADLDRPLAPRGREATKLLRRHIRARAIQPAQVLCSPAVRARQTYEGIAPGGELIVEPELYSVNGEALLDRLRRVPDEVASVMVIGHNPALQMLVSRLAGTGTSVRDGQRRAGEASAEHLAEVRRKFPTGALATLRFTGSWSALGSGQARLVDFVRPCDLR